MKNDEFEKIEEAVRAMGYISTQEVCDKLGMEHGGNVPAYLEKEGIDCIDIPRGSKQKRRFYKEVQVDALQKRREAEIQKNRREIQLPESEVLRMVEELAERVKCLEELLGGK